MKAAGSGESWYGKKSSKMTKEEKRARSKARREEGIQVCIDVPKHAKSKVSSSVHMMAIEWKATVPIVLARDFIPGQASKR